MKRVWAVALAAGAFGLGLVAGHLRLASGEVKSVRQIKRVGMVVGLKTDMVKRYKELHDDAEPGVRDLLNKYGMHNFSIFLQKIDGKLYEFGYYEYTGADFEADMARLAKEPRNIEWLKKCDPMQIPLEGATGWTEMEMVYHND